jgi:hypothetical protein
MLLSYEVERAAISSLDPDAENTAEDRRRRRGLLRLTRAEGRLTGMPVLALLYPSPTLAAIGDPLTILREMPERLSLQNAGELVALEPMSFYLSQCGHYMGYTVATLSEVILR